MFGCLEANGFLPLRWSTFSSCCPPSQPPPPHILIALLWNSQGTEGTVEISVSLNIQTPRSQDRHGQQTDRRSANGDSVQELAQRQDTSEGGAGPAELDCWRRQHETDTHVVEASLAPDRWVGEKHTHDGRPSCRTRTQRDNYWSTQLRDGPGQRACH